MADGARPALGLSIGATNLAAVTPDHSITRKPVLTLFRQRPPEVGVPTENPRLDQPGLVISDFVDRVGDRVGIVAADGSMHRSEALVADGLRALAYAATGGRALPDHAAVTYPAHWGAPAVDALGAALSRVSEWSSTGKPLVLIPDAAAALFAVRANPGIPARGLVAVCDFGGSGTSVTLVDASGDYQPVAPTLRYHDFSGDLVDQSLLTYIMSEMPATGSFDPTATAAIGSLSRLRSECRRAKERLSATTVTSLSDEVPGLRGDVRLTRTELEETIRGPLDGFLQAVEDLLERNGVPATNLVAIATVGGGAGVPAVTTSLSGRFGVPVVTTPRPQLTAAIGAALRAAREPGETSATALTPAAAAGAMAGAAAAASSLPSEPFDHAGPDVHADAPVSVMQPALAWSEADPESQAMPAASASGASPGERSGSGFTAARPQMSFEHDDRPEPERKKPVLPWYRLPAVIIVGTVVAVLLVGTAVAIGLSNQDPNTPSPGVSTVPATPRSSVPAPSSGSVSPQPSAQDTTPEQAPQSTQAPPPSTPAPTEAPAPTTEAPAPTTEAPAPTQPTVQAPPPANQPQAPQVPNPPAAPQVPQIPQIPAPQIPGLPQIPGIKIPGGGAVPGIRIG
ncbi:Hsp70 family protein [Mycobacterium vicinigordonae]|uniref:Hsp70 family protein n=1 Tax=Mycobacterium vicinigordonae TaxID=1719132 RepID=A0A7D6I697_9MYCO|nr:Hsp70 family protein [Mycobacterium vicinigordonae]QLL05617.1 Hsp70 family protein [Mycobacterium vicinigordonae]